MKNKSTRSKAKSPQGGSVQVAVWKDSVDVVKSQDVFTNYSCDTFYDFVRPLRVLEGAGWSSMIQAKPDNEGFFVFTVEDR